MKITLEYRAADSNKFWEVECVGAEMRVRFGKLGASGQLRVKSFDSAADAQREAQKLAAEKRAKGYLDAVTAGAAATASVAHASPDEAAWRGLGAALDRTAATGANAFEHFVDRCDFDSTVCALQALLGNATDAGADGGGNVWQRYVSPTVGGEWLFCIDHENGARYGRLYPHDVFDKIFGGGEADQALVDDRVVHSAFAAGKYSAAQIAEVDAECRALWARSAWLVDLVAGSDTVEPEWVSQLEQEIDRPSFARVPGPVLYWLLRAFFLGDETAFERVRARAATSTLRIVRDALGWVERAHDRAAKPGAPPPPPSLGPLPDVLAARAALRARVASSERTPRAPTSPQSSPVRVLHVQSLGLDTLPASVAEYPALRRINASWNPIATLPEAIGQLAELRELYLQGHALATLPRAFTKLPRLETLVLKGAPAPPAGFDYLAPLAALPETFGALGSLTRLDLGYSELTTLPESFGDLRALARLDLSRTKLTALPESFGRLEALEWLDLGDTPLARLPESFGDLRALRVLEFAPCRLAALPARIGALARLERLWITDYHDIAALPDSFAELVQLRELALSTYQKRFNRSEWITPLAALPRLATLRIDRGALRPGLERLARVEELQLESVDESGSDVALVGQMPSLTRLSLGLTHDFALSPALRKLTQLRQLRLFASGNSGSLGPAMLRSVLEHASTLPALRTLEILDGSLDVPGTIDLGSLTALEALRLEWAPRKQGRLNFAGSLERLRNLRQLTLRVPFAKLGEFPEGSLLETVDLDGCRAKQLPAGLGRARALRKLVLAHNPIGELPEEIDWPALRWLDLRETKLTRLPAGLRASRELQFVDLSVNPGLDARHALAALEGAAALQRLWLRDANLARLPEWLVGHAALEDVRIGGNPDLDLAHALDVLASMPGLKTVSLWGMKLTRLPDAIAKLTGLKTLLLSENAFDTAERRRLRALLPETEIVFAGVPTA